MNTLTGRKSQLPALILTALLVSACGGGGNGDGGGGPAVPDTAPDPIGFGAPSAKLVPGLQHESSAVVVKGIDAGVSIPAVVRGGRIAVNDKAFVEGPVEVRLDDRIRILVAAPDQFGMAGTATLTVGSGNGTQKADFVFKTGESEFIVVPGPKSLTFRWGAMEGASHFKLQENADGASGFTETELDIRGDAVEARLDKLSLHRVDWKNARYQLQACNERSGCVSLPQHELGLEQSMSARAIGRIKASNADAGDFFGYAFDVSNDGRTMVVGAFAEDSAKGTGPGDNSAEKAGAVYVLERDAAGHWVEIALLKGENTEAEDAFGLGTSISGDGNVIAVGATFEDSAATGINGDASDNGAAKAGAVYIFKKNDLGHWEQQAYLKASNTDPGDRFGYPVVLNVDGTRLAVAAVAEQSLATGVNPEPGQEDNSDTRPDTFHAAGAVYIFGRAGEAWSQEAYLKASNTGEGDMFGRALAMNNAGDVIAVGAVYEDSNAKGVSNGANPNHGTDNKSDSGAVYLFEHDGSEWAQSAYVKAPNTDSVDHFGFALAISGDGRTFVVGANREDSAASGVNGDQSNSSMASAGAAYIYAREEGAWTFTDYLKASNPGAQDHFGYAVAISGDGAWLAIGASGEDSSSVGVDGDSMNDDGERVGAVYLFTRTTDSWIQTNYVKAPVWQDHLFFGDTLHLSRTGSALFAFAYDHSASDSPEVVVPDCEAPEPVNCAENSGAVFEY